MRATTRRARDHARRCGGDGDARHGDARHVRGTNRTASRPSADGRLPRCVIVLTKPRHPARSSSVFSTGVEPRARSPIRHVSSTVPVFSVEMATERRALVVGGSGYLGQHLVDVLPRVHGWTCHYTYRDNALPADPSRVGHRADAITGEGMREAVRAALGADRSPTAPAPRALLVVNCAATSSPFACTSAIPPPRSPPTSPPRSSTPWTPRGPPASSAPPAPFGPPQHGPGVRRRRRHERRGDASDPTRQRVRAIQDEGGGDRSRALARTRHTRSSIITGADAPIRPVNRPLFLDFILGALRGDQPVTFFRDEWRCPSLRATPARTSSRWRRRLGGLTRRKRRTRKEHSTWVDRIGSRAWTWRESPRACLDCRTRTSSRRRRRASSDRRRRRRFYLDAFRSAREGNGRAGDDVRSAGARGEGRDGCRSLEGVSSRREERGRAAERGGGRVRRRRSRVTWECGDFACKFGSSLAESLGADRRAPLPK